MTFIRFYTKCLNSITHLVFVSSLVDCIQFLQCVASIIGPLPRLFKLWPQGQYWSLLQGSLNFT